MELEAENLLASFHKQRRVGSGINTIVRMFVCSIIENLVHLRFTVENAIDRIHAIYGSQTSVTDIINQLKAHKKAGTLSPNALAYS
jgi:hypothetical protein